jgi:hypothetical protein
LAYWLLAAIPEAAATQSSSVQRRKRVKQRTARTP